MVSMPKRNEPYGFDKGFERSLVYHACSHPRFYGRIGYAVDADLLATPAAQWAFRAAHAINVDLGHGPDKPCLVLQRLRRWRHEGKVTHELCVQLNDLFDLVEDTGAIQQESIITELTPVLQFRMRDEAIISAMESFSQHRDLSKAVELEGKATRIGQVDTSVGTILGNDSFADIIALSQLDRLRTGIPELDGVLDGGLQRGGLGIAIGGSGDGKSMYLSHVSAVTLLAARTVAYATLELPKEVVLARVKAAITGVPINAMLNGSIAEAQARLAKLSPTLGRFVVQEFPPQATTVDDLIDWVKRIEDQLGHPIELLVVDYGDKVVAKAKKGEGNESEYKTGLVVFEALRTWAHDSKKFCWTASAAQRRKDRKKNLDIDDVADSLHKIRVADLVVTLNIHEEPDKEAPMITIRVGKHRTGRSRVAVGPFDTAYDCGQVVPLGLP